MLKYSETSWWLHLRFFPVRFCSSNVRFPTLLPRASITWRQVKRRGLGPETWDLEICGLGISAAKYISNHMPSSIFSTHLAHSEPNIMATSGWPKKMQKNKKKYMKLGASYILTHEIHWNPLVAMVVIFSCHILPRDQSIVTWVFSTRWSE